MKYRLLSVAAAAAMAMGHVHAAGVKIGFVTTLTTGGAVIGKDMENAVNLAMEHLGGKAGNVPLEVVFAD
ncbi:MAG: ABC transporter substrate-binding protein, partial [Burkholderiaceae bacterium]